MFKHIIWATDGSAHADRALDYAVEMALHDDAGLQVVHVSERLTGPHVTGVDVGLDEDRIVAHIKLQAAAVEAQQGVSTTVEFAASHSGTIAERIAEIAVDSGADLLVVGTRGRSGLAGALLGSVTQRLLHLAPCPVLAVPPHSNAPSPADRTPAAASAH